jgi:hypothetical protein
VVGKHFKDGPIGGTAKSAAAAAQGEKPSAFDAEGMIGKETHKLVQIHSTCPFVTDTQSAETAIGGTA